MSRIAQILAAAEPHVIDWSSLPLAGAVNLQGRGAAERWAARFRERRALRDIDALVSVSERHRDAMKRRLRGRMMRESHFDFRPSFGPMAGSAS